MKRSERILLLLHALIGLAFSFYILAMLYPIPLVTELIKSYDMTYPLLNLIFTGYSAFLGLFFLLVLLAAFIVPGKSDDLVLVKDKGELLFSKQAVESTVRCSFSDIEGVNLTKIRLSFGRHPEKMKIYVKLSVSDANGLVELTESIQNKIEAALSTSLGITVNSINIKVVEFKQKTVAEEDVKELVKSERVV